MTNRERTERARAELVPGLRSRGVPPSDPLFTLNAAAAPAGLAAARMALDGYRCAACGFVSRRYMMVWRHGTSARKLGDLRTLCRPCWQVMNLEAAAAARSAALIWLPEFSQVALNRLMPALYAARVGRRAGASQPAQRLYGVFMERRAPADEVIGCSGLAGMVDRLAGRAADDPEAARLLGFFGQGLRLLPLDRWIVREEGLEFNQYPQMLAYWHSRKGPLVGAAERFPRIAHDWLCTLDAPAELPV